jgi:hypothetical protein
LFYSSNGSFSFAWQEVQSLKRRHASASKEETRDSNTDHLLAILNNSNIEKELFSNKKDSVPELINGIEESASVPQAAVYGVVSMPTQQVTDSEVTATSSDFDFQLSEEDLLRIDADIERTLSVSSLRTVQPYIEHAHIYYLAGNPSAGKNQSGSDTSPSSTTTTRPDTASICSI